MHIQDKFNADSHLISRNKNGNIDTVLVGEKIDLETSVGKLIPRYTLGEDGRKKEAPVKFYKTGELKSMPLEVISEIKTSVGSIKSELLIFYKSGALWRTFPLNGQVTGFWTEENEFELAEAIDVPTSIGMIKVKPIYIQFYETGELESILFWPSEQVKINVSVGEVLIHKGICFHKNGNVKGFEPVEKLSIESPIGTLSVFDPDPNGVHAESHSINFHENGAIQSIITSSNQIVAITDGGEHSVFSPQIVTSYCNDNAFFISPLKIVFEEKALSFSNSNEPAITLSKSLQYKVSAYVPDKPISGVGC